MLATVDGFVEFGSIYISNGHYDVGYYVFVCPICKGTILEGGNFKAISTASREQHCRYHNTNNFMGGPIK